MFGNRNFLKDQKFRGILFLIIWRRCIVSYKCQGFKTNGLKNMGSMSKN